MRSQLTNTQKRYFDWIEKYIDREERSPTIREIMTGLGLASTAPVQSALITLEIKGWVKRSRGARGISISKRYRTNRSTELSTKALLLIEQFRQNCRVYGHDFERALHERLSVD